MCYLKVRSLNDFAHYYGYRSSTPTIQKKDAEEDKPTESNVEEKEAAMSEAKLQEIKEPKEVDTSLGSG